jgi:hypothetical protein
LFSLLPKGKIDKTLATHGIGYPEIDGGGSVFTVAHVGGKDREGALGGFPPLFDADQRVDRKGMPQPMGGRRDEVHISHDPSSLMEADLFQGLVKDIFDLPAI